MARAVVAVVDVSDVVVVAVVEVAVVAAVAVVAVAAADTEVDFIQLIRIPVKQVFDAKLRMNPRNFKTRFYR